MVKYRDSDKHSKLGDHTWSTAKVSFGGFCALRDFPKTNSKMRLGPEIGLQHITKYMFYRSHYPHVITHWFWEQLLMFWMREHVLCFLAVLHHFSPLNSPCNRSPVSQGKKNTHHSSWFILGLSIPFCKQVWSVFSRLPRLLRALIAELHDWVHQVEFFNEKTIINRSLTVLLLSRWEI